jgi:hypothetical protein
MILPSLKTHNNNEHRKISKLAFDDATLIIALTTEDISAQFDCFGYVNHTLCLCVVVVGNW